MSPPRASSSPEPGSPLDTTARSPSPTSRAPQQQQLQPQGEVNEDDGRRRSSTNSTSRFRRASVRFIEANPPPGMWHATGHVFAKAPTLNDIRHGRFTHGGWSAEGQRSRSRSSAASTSSAGPRAGTVDVPRRIPEAPEERGRSAPSPVPPQHHHDDDHHHRHHHKEEKSADTDKVIAGTLTHAALSAELHDAEKGVVVKTGTAESGSAATGSPAGVGADGEVVYANGYKPPPKHTWGQATIIAVKGFWRFVRTPSGFLITLYALNIVAWGGMLFLLLCNAAPAMCRPSCNALESPRRKWIEIDSQILNALFCVTGLGLIPWRFRDLYYLLRWRLQRRRDGLRVLAGVHRGWFRLPGSDKLPPTLTGEAAADPVAAEGHAGDDAGLSLREALPLPPSKAPDAPLTGERAPPTAPWKLDFVVWMNVLNTFFQIALCGFMWGRNRYNRPGWSTGTFVALACIVAALGGLLVFKEGKRVKKVEGVPVTEDDLCIIQEMERGRKM